MAERESILSLLRLGWSERRISREGGHHRATVRRVRREAGLVPAKCTTEPEVPADLTPYEDVEAAAIPATATRSTAEPFRSFIEAELAKRRNAQAIFEDLVEHHGYNGSYDAIKRLARKVRKKEPKVSCRFETELGQEAQVDYGEGALTRHPRTGKYRRPRLFVMTLGNSRHGFRKSVWTSSTETWCCDMRYRPRCPANVSTHKIDKWMFRTTGGIAKKYITIHDEGMAEVAKVMERLLKPVWA
jgi:transposase